MSDTKPPTGTNNNETKEKTKNEDPPIEADVQKLADDKTKNEAKEAAKDCKNGLEVGGDATNGIGVEGGLGANDYHPPLIPQLDMHLAMIEEQFRKGFDERYSVAPNSSQRNFYEDPEETIRNNKIFREVSRALGGDWRKVYDELMKKLPKETVESELAKIQKHQPIIQGYRALLSWKDSSGPRNFSLMNLVQTLNDLDHDDIADVVLHIIDNNEVPAAKPTVTRKRTELPTQKNALLDNRKLLLISKKIGGAYEALGRQLGVPEEELTDIKAAEGDSYQGCFKVLWAWKEERSSSSLSATDEQQRDVDVLREALEKVNLKEVASQITSIV